VLRRNKRYNITVGSCEEITLDKGYSVVLNVADVPFNLNIKRLGYGRYFWYPVNEESKWGFGPFFWAKRLLDEAVGQGYSIGIHCAAGAHRSPMIAHTWIQHTNKREGIIEATFDGDGTDWSITHDNYHPFTIQDRWNIDVKDGTIPNDIFKFYDVMDACPSYGLMGCTRKLY